MLVVMYRLIDREIYTRSDFAALIQWEEPGVTDVLLTQVTNEVAHSHT